MTQPDYAAIEAACSEAVRAIDHYMERYDADVPPWWLDLARPYILAAARVAEERDELRTAALAVLAEWDAANYLEEFGGTDVMPALRTALKEKPQ